MIIIMPDVSGLGVILVAVVFFVIKYPQSQRKGEKACSRPQFKVQPILAGKSRQQELESALDFASTEDSSERVLRSTPVSIYTIRHPTQGLLDTHSGKALLPQSV